MDGSDHCPACGASFILGKPDKWSSEPLTDSIRDLKLSDIMINTLPPSKCLWDGVPPGQPMGMVCTCPKCTVTC